MVCVGAYAPTHTIFRDFLARPEQIHFFLGRLAMKQLNISARQNVGRSSRLEKIVVLRNLLLYFGIAAPLLYVATAIVGAALRPDYSHIVNAISELLSNGAPNKAILDIVFNIYNVLLLAFALGAYSALKNAPRLSRSAMGILIAVQMLSFSWGFFPMDPLGAEATFAGTMHNVLGGVVAFATIVMPLLLGLGLRQSVDLRRYAIYSFVSSAIIFVSGLSGVILAGQGVQVFGLFERMTIGAYEIWIMITALNLLKIVRRDP